MSQRTSITVYQPKADQAFDDRKHMQRAHTGFEVGPRGREEVTYIEYPDGEFAVIRKEVNDDES